MIQKEKSEEEKVKFLENVPIKLIIGMVFLCFFQNITCAETKSTGTSKRNVINWSNLEAVVKGDHIKAILVAYEDFSKMLSRTQAHKYTENDLGYYSGKLENYDILVSKGNRGVDVVFAFRLSDKYPALLGNGGITRYLINPETYQIIEVDKQK